MTDVPSKRAFRSFRDFAGSVGHVIRGGKKLKAISSAFRERLMLVVTGINECSHCAVVHSKAARLAGVPDEEIERLLRGEVEDSPAEELPALRYAIEWARLDGAVTVEAGQAIEQQYGEKKAEAIEVALRTIRAGNLAGNSIDRFVNKVTFGRAPK